MVPPTPAPPNPGFWSHFDTTTARVITIIGLLTAAGTAWVLFGDITDDPDPSVALAGLPLVQGSKPYVFGQSTDDLFVPGWIFPIDIDTTGLNGNTCSVSHRAIDVNTRATVYWEGRLSTTTTTLRITEAQPDVRQEL